MKDHAGSTLLVEISCSPKSLNKSPATLRPLKRPYTSIIVKNPSRIFLCLIQPSHQAVHEEAILRMHFPAQPPAIHIISVLVPDITEQKTTTLTAYFWNSSSTEFVSTIKLLLFSISLGIVCCAAINNLYAQYY